jgi:hypothetical protein
MELFLKMGLDPILNLPRRIPLKTYNSRQLLRIL